jgi:hypothetical protein|tara:strand:+ start:357 stop:554 length:198 start_codon:yes stop_codon:yes gene_type:complete
MEAAAIIAIISVSITGLATLMTAFFTSMSLSRCSKIVCCFGCFDCDRAVVNEEIVARQLELTNNI